MRTLLLSRVWKKVKSSTYELLVFCLGYLACEVLSSANRRLIDSVFTAFFTGGTHAFPIPRELFKFQLYIQRVYCRFTPRLCGSCWRVYPPPRSWVYYDQYERRVAFPNCWTFRTRSHGQESARIAIWHVWQCSLVSQRHGRHLGGRIRGNL